MNIFQEVMQAEHRIRPYIRETYLEPSAAYSRPAGANVYFKLENLQHTGSFKVRGALNKVLALTAAERDQGIITASTGNHGAAVAFALRQVGAAGTVCVPAEASPAKVANIERLGANIQRVPGDPIEAEKYARRTAAESGMTYISPYNDVKVVGGQGTVGVELGRQLDHIDAVFVALGGGGLISGMATYLKQVQPGVRIIGCSPEHSQVMVQSVKAGHVVDIASQPTLSDGTAGGVEADTITFGLCRDLVDSYETVTEAEIGHSLRHFVQTHHMLIEGAAAVPIAAYVKRQHAFAGQNVVIVLCGANISTAALKEIL